MEKKRNGAYFAKMIFSVLFVIVMMVTTACGVYRGSDYLIKYKSEKYQKYYGGYLQENTDAEDTMMKSAEQAAASAYLSASGGEDTNVDDYTLDGIHEVVDVGTFYFEKNRGNEEISKNEGSSEIDPDTFFDDKDVAFYYNGDKAYMKYADGTIAQYTKVDKLNDIQKSFGKMTSSFSYTDISVYVWVDKSYYEQSNLGLRHINTLDDYGLNTIIIAFVIAAASFCLAGILSVRTKRGMEKEKQVITEFPLFVMGVWVIGILILVSEVTYSWGILGYYNENIKEVVTGGLCISVLIVFLAVRECILKIKDKRFFKDSLVVRIFSYLIRKMKEACRIIFVKSNYTDFPLTKKLWVRRIIFILLSAIYCLFAIFMCAGLAVTYYYDYFSVDYFYIILFVVIYGILFIVYNIYEMKFLKSLNEVHQQIDDISKGEYAIRKVEENDLTYDMVEKLNRLSDGMEEAVEKRLSSEKMKVELITNVSHDLKTPLTSIISYVDLLKEEEMSDVASAYVKILEDKSYQLKNIVSDVFDLAKANSGQDVEIETIDGIMLINQVLADMSDNIERSGKVLKADINPETFFIKGDGKKLYRALQNLIENALKYSMEGTRVYITSRVYEEKLKVVIKNIASYEMGFSGEDIVERFVRGDESRTTEGSGLGLSIAKSFIEVSGGSMEVEVDGDVFKVTVEF